MDLPDTSGTRTMQCGVGSPHPGIGSVARHDACRSPDGGRTPWTRAYAHFLNRRVLRPRRERYADGFGFGLDDVRPGFARTGNVCEQLCTGRTVDRATHARVKREQ